MGLYNFQARFVPFIQSGEKRHTIRAIRVHPDVAGNTLHLYTGLRLKRVKGKSQAKLLMRVPCVKVEEIHISMTGAVTVDGQSLSRDECESLAQRDGFNSFGEMLHFWRTPVNRLPFAGHVIHWDYEKRRM